MPEPAKQDAMLIDSERFFSGTGATFLSRFHGPLRAGLDRHVRRHGQAEEWDAVIRSLPSSSGHAIFDADTVVIGGAGLDANPALRALLPWRKGPFRIGGTYVDAEWRSNWKWRRITPHISPLKGRHILDIGCGNGYYLFRMLGEGARLALGVDPTILFNYQFALMQRLAPENNAYLLPLRSEHLPAFAGFDSVFSLGVLYHRRSPVNHLGELFSFLRPGGELILETLIVDGNANTVLIPERRYAKMANVRFIPSPTMLETLLKRTGFADVRTVDVTITTPDEQRVTPWMTFQSLADFLDPDDASRTVEGHPAPTRAILVARKPT